MNYFRNGIRDPGVLYNSKAIQDLLQRWGNQLAKVEKEFQKECIQNLPKTIQENMTMSFLSGFGFECRKLLFTQLSSAFGEISNAAMLCFETNIYPKNCSLLRKDEISLLNLDTTLDDIYKNTREQWKTLNELSSNIEESIELQNLSDVIEDIVFIENLDSQHIEPISDQLQDTQRTMTSLPSNESFSSFDSCDVPRTEDGKNRSFSESLSDQVSLDPTPSNSEFGINTSYLTFDVGGEELRENPFLCENFNVQEGDECQLCVVDKCRACFVLRYFPVLNFTRIRSLLLWNGGCRWRTWLSCMVHLKGKFIFSQDRGTKYTGLNIFSSISSKTLIHLNICFVLV